MMQIAKDMRSLLWVLLSATLIASCASIGNPSGGPRDEDPPRFVRANPAPGSVNVDRKRIDIEFDELVNVKDAFQKVVVSPTSKSVPRVSSLGKKVTVQFNDSLLPNTTYTIDFANSIEDNNENNKLQGFTYSFSTGPTLDTLQISGMVLSADAMHSIITNKALYNTLRDRGIEEIHNITWEKAGKKVIDIYKKVIDARK